MPESTDKQPPEWLQLETLIAEIQKQLAPGANVTHNAMLPGYDSETTRQIDVLVEQSVGQFSMFIVIDCKDYKVPVNVKGVEEFIGLVKDVRAHQGCLVSAKGFTPSAKKVARRANIALYSPVDTAPHKWQTRGLALPVLCEFRSAAIAFGIRVSAPVPFRMSQDFMQSLVVCDEHGNKLGTCLDTALDRWNSGEFPVEEGTHDELAIFSVVPYVDNGYGTQIAVELYATLIIKGRRYFGYLPLQDIRGLRDEHTGAVHTNAFKTGVLDPVVVENQWQRLKDGEVPPKPVAITIMGLDCWEIDGRRTGRG